MNKRLEMLKKMTASGQADAFAWYALAMEYRREQDVDRAREAFAKLRSSFPEYLPAYLMAGQLLTEAADPAAARDVLEAGIALAERQGEVKALGELRDALDALG